MGTCTPEDISDSSDGSAINNRRLESVPIIFKLKPIVRFKTGAEIFFTRLVRWPFGRTCQPAVRSPEGRR
jgi:hypothetical protein